MDEARLKASFAAVAAYGDEIALFFYSHLFLGHPELRGMFPVSMAGQRDRLLNALGRIVSDVSNADSLVTFLQGLGREHRKFGTLAEHYPAVGASLLATLAHFSGPAWTPDLANDWAEAYGLIASVMSEAAAEDEAANNPAWWDAIIVGHERRTLDVSVLRVAPRVPLPYVPGQSVAIEYERRPRLWRFYSPANAPRADGTIDFHVRLIDGGAVSPALARGAAVGSRLRLSAPVGSLALGSPGRGLLPPGRELLLAAGGTGLAPLKAIVEQAAALPAPPRTRLVFGARTARELYDLPDLEKMAAQWPWLTVTPAVSDEAHSGSEGGGGQRGTVADVIASLAPSPAHEAFVCGSPAMVDATVSRLESVGMPREQIHFEEFAWSRA
jgi:NAD(P)H-flavin reductase/hemoglobin-like flavoprotein